jgi:hypothetical protein
LIPTNKVPKKVKYREAYVPMKTGPYFLNMADTVLAPCVALCLGCSRNSRNCVAAESLNSSTPSRNVVRNFCRIVVAVGGGEGFGVGGVEFGDDDDDDDDDDDAWVVADSDSKPASRLELPVVVAEPVADMVPVECQLRTVFMCAQPSFGKSLRTFGSMTTRGIVST